MDLKRKILFILVAVIVFAGAFLAVIWPHKKAPKAPEPVSAIERYKLPDDYTREDIASLVEEMKKDKEFKFYFHILDEQREQETVDEAAAILTNAASASAVLEEIKRVYERTSALSFTFYYLDYPPEYARDPTQFPKLEAAFWKFVEEAFLMTVLGVVYKANYDQSFVFQWNEASVLAAKKLQEIWNSRQEYLGSTGG